MSITLQLRWRSLVSGKKKREGFYRLNSRCLANIEISTSFLTRVERNVENSAQKSSLATAILEVTVTAAKIIF
jgi:hypothetical protein